MNKQVEQIRTEIERRRDAIDYTNRPSCAEYNRVWAYNDVLSIIDSMPKETASEDFEKEFNRFLDDVEGVPRMWHSDEQMEWGMDIARHFANWQKEQDIRDMLKSDETDFVKCYERGQEDMKKQVLKDAIDGVVQWSPDSEGLYMGAGSLRIKYDRATHGNPKEGDKVKILIIKED